MSQFQVTLAKKFDKPFPAIFTYAQNASKRYRKYKIPKKNGEDRIILQPSAELKQYQRFIVTEIIDKLPVHESVYSYQKGRNVKKMALNHLHAKYLLRIDFKNFFPSIEGKHIRELLRRNTNTFDYKLSDNDITLINMLVCRFNKLSIGAPSSPAISNALLYELDTILFDESKKMDIVYTRYADDLYFSSLKPDRLKFILPMLKELLMSYFVKLTINEEKNTFTSKKRRQMITGLVLTSNNSLSVGRSKKRVIKSLICDYIHDKISPKQHNYLKGYLSYLYSIEPNYIDNLRLKYTDKVINRLLPLKAK